MKLLLDTHVLLWALCNDPQLSLRARNMIEDETNEIYYSIVSPWEVEIKRLAHPDRMALSSEQLSKYCSASGFYCLPVRESHINQLKHLHREEQAPEHKDPFDRIMICQAMAEKMLFLTHDRQLILYQEACIIEV